MRQAPRLVLALVTAGAIPWSDVVAHSARHAAVELSARRALAELRRAAPLGVTPPLGSNFSAVTPRASCAAIPGRFSHSAVSLRPSPPHDVRRI